MPARSPSTVVVSTRVSLAAGCAIDVAAREARLLPSAWLRVLLAERLGVPVTDERPARPRRKRRRSQPREERLAQIVTILGGLGGVLAARVDTPPELVTEIRAAVALLVATITDPDPA